MERVPLVLVTGFLGSGKTTLLNRLLRRRAERGARGKLGVIVNELGEVGIDGALLGGTEGEPLARQVELPGGCVCCAIGDDLERTLLELIDANPELDAIVLETTGVAEPIPIAWAVERPPASERVRLAAVIALVDASEFRASRAVSPAVDAQVAYADVILVTKAELAGARETSLVESEIRTIASQPLVWIRGTDDHVAWLESVLEDPRIDRVARPADQDHADRDHPDDCADDCRHPSHSSGPSAHGIDSIWVAAPDTLDLEELEERLAGLPANYVRIKGIIRAVDPRIGAAARWIAVHRVGLRVSSEPLDAPDTWSEIEQPCIVALGPGVRAGVLVDCIDASAA